MKPEGIVEIIKRKNKILTDSGCVGITQSSIADEIGRRQSGVNQVIHKKQTSKLIKTAIYEHVKDLTKETFEEFWDKKDM